jgi:pyruvate/2-oxoglutarate/acetoin dehydrogenase E1 component
MLHGQQGHVPAEPYTVPFGKARLLARGSDVTLVGISYMALECLRAQRGLEATGIHADVIDPVSLTPLDMETIIDLVRKTGRLVVVDTAWTSCGLSAEIAARVVERLGGTGRLQIHRMGYAPVSCPTTKRLQDLFYPSVEQIASAAYRLVRGDAETWRPAPLEAPELVAFKGPF